LQNVFNHIESHYFDDITAVQSPRTSGRSLAQERREELSVVFRGLITPKPAGAHLNIKLYTEDLRTAYKKGVGVPILKAGLDMLQPILGELQKIGWEISLTFTEVSKDNLRLFNWLKKPGCLSVCSVADFFAAIDAFLRVGRLCAKA
jgi:hypothetical protein